jgi:hypothetical protein
MGVALGTLDLVAEGAGKLADHGDARGTRGSAARQRRARHRNVRGRCTVGQGGVRFFSWWRARREWHNCLESKCYRKGGSITTR